ncbi:hypothetical protein AB0C39_05480 [Streptomyces parvulus]|uniref:hypothetical protein n=1 Tax=Streptomyces parvulus TaxID=146923 RepID=UPI0033EEEF42
MSENKALQVYEFAEEWWDERFGHELISKVSRAPMDQILAFERDWPGVSSLGFGEGVPEISTGSVRPVFKLDRTVGRPGTKGLDDAIRSLLLVESAVIDSLYLDPFEWLDRGWRSHFTSREDFDDWQDEMKVLLPQRLEIMRKILPLIKNQSLFVANMQLNLRDKIAFESVYRTSVAIESDLLSIPTISWRESADHEDIDDVTRFARSVAVPVELARSRKASLVSESDFDDEVWRNLLSRTMRDGRVTRIGKLGRLSYPNILSDVDTLIKIRRNDSHYAALRDALATSLDDLGDLSEGPDGLKQASEILQGNLQERLHEVDRAVSDSPALSALRDGSTRMTVSSVGLVAGAAAGATSSIFAGAATGAAAAATAGLQKYLETLADRRKNRLVWDFVLSFRRDIEETERDEQ